jgi:hypothetical protein
MRIVTNQKLVKRNRQIATYLFLATLVLLIGGFIFINYSFFTGEEITTVILLLQALMLPAAFILTLFSVRMTNLWARQPYPDEAIAEGLKGLSKKSILYNYYHFPARHILIAPQGVFVLVTRWHEGQFSVEGDRWKTKKGGFSRLFSAMRMDGVGEPTLDAQKAVKHAKKLFADIAPDIEVKPLIVFVSPKAELEIKEPVVPVFYIDDKQEPNLTEFMRELNREQKDNLQQKAKLPLTDKQISTFEALTLPKEPKDKKK